MTQTLTDAATANGRGSPSRTGTATSLTPLNRSGRRRRLGLAAIGGLFILVAGLVGASLFNSLRSSTPVLALRGDLAAGETLTADRLVVVELGTDGLGQLSYVSAERQGEVVGQTALGPIPAGSLLSPAMFGARGEVIPPGHAVVGVVLDRGALPAGIVQPGDDIELIATIDSPLADDGVVADMVGRGQVWVVEPATELERGTSLSIVVASELVPVVAQAAADDRLRIGLIGQ